jgi:hypothetical protein
MDNAHKELREAIALLEVAIRKMKVPPDELKRAKSKLVEYIKKMTRS